MFDYTFSTDSYDAHVRVTDVVDYWIIDNDDGICVEQSRHYSGLVLIDGLAAWGIDMSFAMGVFISAYMRTHTPEQVDARFIAEMQAEVEASWDTTCTCDAAKACFACGLPFEGDECYCHSCNTDRKF